MSKNPIFEFEKKNKIHVFLPVKLFEFVNNNLTISLPVHVLL